MSEKEMATPSDAAALPGNGGRFSGTRGVLWALTAQVFINMLGLGIVSPVLPLYARSFGVGAAMVGLLVTGFGVARIIANIPVGTLTERLGRKPLLFAGPIITCVSALMSGLAQRFEVLLIFRFCQGIGSAALTTTAMTVLADITDRKTRGKAMSLYQGMLLLGQSFGPTVGGLVGEHLGYRAPFFAYSLLSIIGATWSFFVVPETRGYAQAKQRAEAASAASSGAPQSTWNVMRSLLLNPSFLLISFVSFMGFFTRSGSRNTILPLFGSTQLGLTPSQLGFGLTFIAIWNLLTLNLSGSLSDKWGRKTVIVPASILSGVALVTYTFSGSYAFFLFSAALLGIGTGLSGPAPAAYVADLAKPGQTGITLGLYRTLSDVGMSVSPVLLGWIVDRFGFSQALYVNAIMYAIAGAAFGLFAQETVRRQVVPEKSTRTA